MGRLAYSSPAINLKHGITMVTMETTLEYIGKLYIRLEQEKNNIENMLFYVRLYPLERKALKNRIKEILKEEKAIIEWNYKETNNE